MIETCCPWWTPGVIPVNTTQKSSWSAQDASSCAIARAAAFLLCIGVGVLRAEGSTMGLMVLRRFPVLAEAWEDNGIATVCPLCGVNRVCEGIGEALWGLYAWTRWGVVGGTKGQGGTERIGGIGYGFEPKDSTTSPGRRAVVANSSQALWASWYELYPLKIFLESSSPERAMEAAILGKRYLIGFTEQEEHIPVVKHSNFIAWIDNIG